MKPFPLFPREPNGYRGRRDVEEEVITRLMRENLVVLVNKEGESGPTGKSSVAAAVCNNHRIQQHFSDVILWVSFKWEINSSSYESFLRVLYQELRNRICPSLSAVAPCPPQSTWVSQFWESRIFEVISILGTSPKCLVVLDNVAEKSVLQPLESLGLTVMVTTRYNNVSRERSVEISALLSSASSRSIFDIEEADKQSPFVCSLSNLLQSAYKLGFGDGSISSGVECNNVVPGSLVAKLLCNFSTLSDDTKEKFLLLSSLPTDTFLPVNLAYCIWSSAFLDGNSASQLTFDRDILQFYSLSLIRMTIKNDAFVIPQESQRLMSVIFAQAAVDDETDKLSALKEDSFETLEYALTNDKDNFESFCFHKYPQALYHCFRVVGWSKDDIIANYSKMFEKEIESSQFIAKNYSSKMLTLNSVEKVINAMNLAHTVGKRASLGHDKTVANDNVLSKWLWAWLSRIIEYKKVLFESYHGENYLPIDFCNTLDLFSELSFQCGCYDLGIQARKDIIEVQRSCLSNDDPTIGVSLFNLASNSLKSISSQLNSLSNDTMSIKKMSGISELSLRCNKEYIESSLTSFMVEQSYQLHIQVLRVESTDESNEKALQLLNELLDHRKRCFKDAYHPLVADVYRLMAEVCRDQGNFNKCIKFMNKHIRIVREIYGNTHVNTANALSFLADCHIASGNVGRAETLLSKAAGVMRVLSDQDSSLHVPLESLVSSLAEVSNTTAKQVRSNDQPSHDKSSPSVEDAVLMIAFADKTLHKDSNCAKAKKYIFKALKSLSTILPSNDTPAQQKNVVKWSAYNKLADICVLEGNLNDAVRFYLKAMKGFLSIRSDVNDPSLREQRAEGIVIAFHLAALVHKAIGFHAAAKHYIRVVLLILEMNSIICKQSNRMLTKSKISSSVDHGSYLTTIADEFEANMQSLELHASNGSGTDENEAIANFKANAVHEIRSLALPIFLYHLGAEDELSIDCQEKLSKYAPRNVGHTNAVDFDAISEMLEQNEKQQYVQNEEVEASPNASSPLLLADLMADKDSSLQLDWQDLAQVTSGMSETALEMTSTPLPCHPPYFEKCDNSNDRVFVFAFGCCRRNQLHSDVLSGSTDASYIGTTTTVKKYFMFINKLDGKPFITTQALPSNYAGVTKGVSCSIVGEVYKVSRSTLGMVSQDVTSVNCAAECLPIKKLDKMSGEKNALIYVTDVNALSDEFIANCRNIPRGNYAEFVRARGGIEGFIENSKSSLKFTESIQQ